MRDHEPQTSHDVVVIGAGQAGLALGHYLAQQRTPFVVLDRASSVGSAWHDRWRSLTLFTPRRYDGLPGVPFPGEPDGYPSRDEVIAYLERYADERELPVELSSEVRKLTARNGSFLLELDDRTIAAEQVVVATGPFQAPYVPDVASGLGPEVVQMHSTVYKDPGDVADGAVLVVGGGNTGFQIAEELSATKAVHLSIGTKQKPLPQRLLGRDLFWWLTKSRLLRTTVDSRLGRRLRHRELLIGSSPHGLKRQGVELHPRATEAFGRIVRFEDGSVLEVDSVVWATGYRPDFSWIEAPVLDPDGRPRHRRGVTEVPGLYFLGLTWQHTRGSALLGWVKEDAEFIAGEIESRRASRAGAQPAGPEKAAA
jgi:putative flavoprotein involved in K+ transport